MKADPTFRLPGHGEAVEVAGLSIDQIDTPALLVDVDRLERNLERWQRYCDQYGLRCRPHVKTHKCVEIARRQIDLGATGVVCQKLGEAEVMAAAGILDILIPYNIVGERKLQRLSTLSAQARVSVAIDSEATLHGLRAEWSTSDTQLGVLVECDTGHGRAGVQTPHSAVRLAASIARSSGLTFEGFLTHPVLPGCASFLSNAIDEAGRSGIEARTISVGGTPTMWRARELRPPITEYRAGTYVFLDRLSIAAGAGGTEDLALTVLTTVVSRPTRDRAIVDAGSKCLSSDRGPDVGFGVLLGLPACRVYALDEEHGYVDGVLDTLEVGRRVRVIPNHACAVTNLFDRFVVVSGEQVVGAWPIAARGRSA